MARFALMPSFGPQTFLDDVDRFVDGNFRGRLSALYAAVGRPAHDPVRMQKLGFVQRLYNLSDEEVVRQLDDRRSFEAPDSVQINFNFACGDSIILAAMEHEPPFSIESIVPNPALASLRVEFRVG